MKVLLINPHTSSRSTAGRYRRFLAPMPPISLAYIAASLERAGIEVAVYDDYTTAGDRDLLIEAIRKQHPDVVGLSCVTPTAPRTYDIAKDIRASFPDLKIVLGNLHPSVFHEDILGGGLADVVVIGEGEETIVDLVQTWSAGRPLRDVKGIAFLESGAVTATEPRPYIADLDSIPFPAWHLFPIERYQLFNFARVRDPGTLVLGSRGCPYNCNFCSLKIMGRRRRRRSAANICDEFEFLHDRFGYVQPSFIDPIFPLSDKEAFEFSDEVIRRGLHKKIVWITETRVDLVNEAMLVAMRKAGLARIMYGFESGNDSGLDSINKNTSVELARQAVAMTRKAGVQIIGFFMIGVPGDTVESIERTISFSKSLDIDFAKYTVFSPFPGTQVYEDMKASGEIRIDGKWERYTNYPTKDNPPAFLPEKVSNADIVRLQRKAFVTFYLRPLMMLKHLFKIRVIGVRDVYNGIMTLIKG